MMIIIMMITFKSRFKQHTFKFYFLTRFSGLDRLFSFELSVPFFFLFVSMSFHRSQRRYSAFLPLSIIHIDKTNQFTGEFQMCIPFFSLCSCSSLFSRRFLHFVTFFALDCREVCRKKRLTTPTMKEWRHKKLTNTFVARVFPASETIIWVLSWITTEPEHHIASHWLSMSQNGSYVCYTHGNIS